MGTVVERDDPRLVDIFIKDGDVVLILDDDMRVWRLFGGPRNAGQVASRLTIHVLIHLAPRLFAYGLGQVWDSNTAHKKFIGSARASCTAGTGAPQRTAALLGRDNGAGQTEAAGLEPRAL